VSATSPEPYAVGSPARHESPGDRCPGAVRLFEASDGWIARIRLGGQSLDPTQVAGIASLATELGDGHVDLTSRAGLQLRGLAEADGERLADALSALGLLPSLTHERARNIVSAPFGDGSVERCAALLDQALCADPALARLSGRFLFRVDDGAGDLDDVPADISVTPGDDAAGAATAADRAVAAARAFLELADTLTPTPWQVRDLDPVSVAWLRSRLAGPRPRAGEAAPGPDVLDLPQQPSRPPAPVGHRSPGLVTAPDGSTFGHVLAPLGRVPAQVWGLAGSSAPRLRVAPWRAVVLVGLDRAAAELAVHRLVAAGWIGDVHHPLAGHTACAGLPGCSRSRADVRADAQRLAPSMADRTRPVHWAGCERRCGHPGGPHVDRLATGPGRYASTAPKDLR
jgi:precorrin-3B synthase